MSLHVKSSLCFTGFFKGKMSRVGCEESLVIDTRDEDLREFLSRVPFTWPNATVRMNADELYLNLFRLALRIHPRGALRLEAPGMFLDLGDTATEVVLESILAHADINIIVEQAVVDVGDWGMSPRARRRLTFERVLATGLPHRGEANAHSKKEAFQQLRLMSPNVITKLDKSTDLAIVQGLNHFMINKADLSHFKQRLSPKTKFMFRW